MTDLTTIPDRALEDAAFMLDVKIGELLEIDAVYGDPDGPPAEVVAIFDERDAIRTEIERRVTEGVPPIIDPDEPTLEQRLGPYGIEWEIEQRERGNR